MLNKELLITGITRKEPHVILMVDEGYIVSQSADGYGYDKYSGIGMISRIPCWVFNNPAKLQTLATVPESYQTIVSWDDLFYSKRLVITRLDTGRSVEFVNTDSYTYGLRADDASFFTRADAYNEIPLIFDPPQLLFGSRYGQTDLGRGYYVEEVPWETQDAEQGITDGGCGQCLCEMLHRNLCPRDCIPKIRRRSSSTGHVEYGRRSNLRHRRCKLYRVHSPKNLSVQCSKPASRIGRSKLQIYGSRHYETCGTNFVLRQLTDAKEAPYAE